MLPDQVADQWNILKPAIEASLPSNTAKSDLGMNNILKALIGNKMHCWILTDTEESEPYALATTSFVVDPIGAVSLFIYSLYGYKPIPMELWIDGFKGLQKWAMKNGCSNVLAFTDSKRVMDIVKDLGGNTQQVVVSLEVNSNGENI